MAHLFSVFQKLSNNGKTPLDKKTFQQGLCLLGECGLKNLEETPFGDRLFTLVNYLLANTWLIGFSLAGHKL